MMQSLGEMATQLPIAGSFEAYAERFVDPSLGFAVGWNYWFSWAITLAAELVAGALIVKFWFPQFGLDVVGHGFFCGAAGLESFVGQGVRRSGILVRRHQGGHRDHFPGGGCLDDRRHDGQSRHRLPQLDLARPQERHACALCRRPGGSAGGVLGGRVFLSRHRGCGTGRRRNRQPQQKRAQGHQNRVLADPAVLHRFDLRRGHVDQFHGPQPAARRRGAHRLLALHHGVPAVAAIRLLRVQPHERGDFVVRIIVRKFLHVRGLAHAVRHGPQPQGAGNIRHTSTAGVCPCWRCWPPAW